jgi:hypothetical protein
MTHPPDELDEGGLLEQGHDNEGRPTMTGDDDPRQAYERALAALLAGPRSLTEVDIETARRAAQFLDPNTYRRAGRPVPPEGDRYRLAGEYIRRARAAHQRTDHHDDKDTT